jgi:GWxTD domain-containing protein
MKNKAMICLLIFFLSSNLAISQKKIKEEDLSLKYQEWLKQVTYFILPQEKDVFLRLDNDRERDIFVETFWKQRDPTPGTPENEYREEMKNRFEYVTKEFRKGSGREGWMTDMGRIYMILGKPVSRESFTLPELYPCETWSYYGNESKGMPPSFGFIFFRRAGLGEFKLYSPAVDGPKSLFVGTSEVPDDAWEGYERIREIAPTLAPLVLSIIPNDMSADFGPSLRSDITLATILGSPRKEVSASYATHFLNYKGMVSTDYLTNYVDCEAEVALTPDPLQGIHFLHYAVVPKTVSVDFYEAKNQYYCNYTVDVSLKKGEAIIYQYSKDFSYYFPPEDSPLVVANGISLQDSFPVIDGQYKLTVLLRNSVGKEFSLVERNVSVESAESPRIFGALLGYKLEAKGDRTHTAFQVLDRRVFVDPKSSFTAADTISLLLTVENLAEELWKRGEVRVSVRGLQTTNPAQKNFSLKLNTQPFHRISVLSYSFSASELAPDYYEMTLRLVDGQQVLDERTASFIISTAPALARPIVISKIFPRSSFFQNYYVLAGQSESVGDFSRAETYFQRALEIVPDDQEGLAYYSGFLLRSKKFEKALEFIEKIKDEPTLRFDYWIIKGKALKELGRCEEAIACLLEGNKIYNSDIRLLNALGYCFYKTGERGRALEVLNASLRINPDQEEAKKLIEEIQKK